MGEYLPLIGNVLPPLSKALPLSVDIINTGKVDRISTNFSFETTQNKGIEQ